MKTIPTGNKSREDATQPRLPLSRQKRLDADEQKAYEDC